MKKTIQQSLSSLALIVIVFIASAVSAGNPAVPSPGGFSGNNTPLPVNTSGSYDIKGQAGQTGGGLSVEAFIAKKNASFDGAVGIQGILTGAVNALECDNTTADTTGLNQLYFGCKPTASAVAANNVTVDIAGTTYAGQAGLYSERAKTRVVRRLCADNNGIISLCPTSGVTYTPPPSPANAVMTIKHQGTMFTVTLDQPITADIVINKVTSDGYSNTSCTPPGVGRADSTRDQILRAGYTSMTFVSDTIGGSWNNVVKQKVYNLSVAGAARTNGDVVTLGANTVTINTPPCI